MNYQLQYSVSASFTLTDDEFTTVTDAIRNNHEISYHADLGGFWYGNINRRNFAENKSECMLEATTRQLDVVILKSLESYRWHPIESPAYSIGKSLYVKMYKVLEHAIKTAGELNKATRVIEL